MDNFEVLIYIIFGLIYLISRAFRKKKPGANKPRPRPSQTDQKSSDQKPLTFEDLLKELTGESQSSKSEPEAKPQPEPESYYREEREESYSETYRQKYDLDDSEAMETYQRAKERAKDVKTINELVDLEKIEIGGRFEEFKTKEKVRTKGDEIREMLEDRENAKNAIILSEIFNRKY